MNEILPSATRATNLTNVKLNDGSVSEPSMSFLNDTDTGWWLQSAGNMALAVNGTNRLIINSSKIEMNFSGVSLPETLQASVPTPSTNYYMLFIDSVTKHLSYKKSDTSIVDLTYTDARTISAVIANEFDTLKTSNITNPVSNTDLLITTSGTGRLSVNSGSSYPINNNHVATKEYVDNYAAGLKVRPEVKTKTSSNLSATYNNLTFTLTSTAPAAIGSIGGYALSLNDRVLVDNQTDPIENGIYTVTDLGSGITSWVLTRADDLDGSPTYEVSNGVYVFIASGTFIGRGYVLSTPNSSITGPDSTIVIGTDPLIWAQFAGAGTGTLSANHLVGVDSGGLLTTINLNTYVTGTTDQVIVTDSSGAITLSLPQSINTTSSPTFANLTDTGLTASTLIYSNGSKQLSSVTLTSNLTLTSGTLDTTQNIQTTSSPTFANLTDTGLTANTLIYSNGSKLLSSVTLGSGITLTTGTLANSGVLSITGTTDQIIASASTGAITLSLPQSINTTSSPTFANLTDTGLTASTLVYSNGSKLLSSVTLGSGITLTTGTLANSGVLSITGTTDQIIASASTGAITLSLPQSINTTSSPTFANLTDTGLTASTLVYSNGSKLLSSVTLGSSLTLTSGTLTTAQAITTSSDVQFNTLALGAAISSDRTLYNNKALTGTSGALYNMYINGALGASSGTVAATYGIYVHPVHSNNVGTITNSYGIYSDTGTTAGTITNGYSGYFVNPAMGATSKIALYADNLAIGTTGTTPPTNGILALGSIQNTALTASRLVYSDTSKNLASVTLSSNLTLTSGTLDTVQGIQTSSNVRFNKVGVGIAATYDIDANNGSNAIIRLSDWASISGDQTGAALFGNNFHRSSAFDYRYTNTHGAIGYAGMLCSAGAIYFFGALGSATAGTAFTPTERMRISATGLIGIGNNSPSAPLHIDAGATVESVILNGSKTIDDHQTGFLCSARFYGTGDGNYVNAFYSQPIIAPTSPGIVVDGACFRASPYFTGNTGTVTNAYGFYYDGGGTSVGTITNAYGLYVANPVAGTNKYCAYFAGNVGVGTATPTVNFEASSANYPPMRGTRTSAITTGNRSAISCLHSTSADMTDGFSTLLTFDIMDSTATVNSIADIGATRSGADNSGSLVFRTYSAGTAAERMRIDSVGLVGIGTATPNTTLEVSGNINQSWSGTPWIGTRFYSSGLDSTGSRYTLGMTYDVGSRIVNFDSTQPDGTGGFVWNTGDSQAAKTVKMTLSKTGNLGINTNSSSTIQLNVLGATNNHAMQGYCQSSGYWGGIFYNSSSTTEVDLAGGTYAAVFKNGNVGIGDTAPSNKLVVKADGTFGGGLQQLVIKGSTNANKQLQLGYDTTTNCGYIQATTAGSTWDPMFINPGGGNTTIGAGLNTTTFATSNTNTSIGGGGSGLYLSNISNTTNNLFEIFFGGANGGYGEIFGCCTNQTSSYGDIAFATRSAAGYSEKMRIVSTGNVGIGISNPDCIHHVNNGSDTISWSHYTNSITGSTVNDGSVVGNASSDLYLWNREAGNIFIGQNNTTKVLINTSGELNPKSNTVMENNYAIFFKASSGIYNNSTQGSSIIKDSSNDMYYDIQENKSHVFRSNSWVERLRINSSAITMSPDITDMGRNSSLYIFVRATNSNLVYNNNASLSAMTSTGDAYTLEFNPSVSTGVLNTDVANVDAYSKFRYGSKIIFAPCYGTLLTSTSGQTQTLSNSSFAKLATFTAGGNSNVCSVDTGNDWITMPNVVYNGQFQYVVSILCRVSSACDVSVYVNPSGHTQVFPLTTTNNTIHYVSYATLAGGDVCTVQVKCSAGSPTFTVDSALFTINRISC